MAELQAARKPPLPDPFSQASISSSIFDSQATESEQEDSRFRPLPSMSTDAFVPYLDDTTGMDLDATTSGPVLTLPREPSSPVESFSPSFHTQAAPVVPEREENMARVGNWVLPVSSDHIRPDPPDYLSAEVLAQMPFLDEMDDEDFVYSSQQHLLARPSQPSPPQPPPTLPPPRESTPTEAVQLVPASPELPPVIPSARVRSPSPPLHRIVSPEPTQPIESSLQPTADTQSNSSFGWSTLPKREVIELMHQSPHIPDFLKDEIERFVLRGRRVASSQTTSQRNSRHRSPVQSQSQSQSLGASNDDSETQEDNFLRTKRIWYMDLLVASSGTQPSNAHAQAWRMMQSQTSSPSQMKDVGLLLYAHEGTFSVQEIEENFASVLRGDTRYSVWYDCHHRRWNTRADVGAPPEAEADPAARQLQLEDKVEQLQKECEAAVQQKAAAQKEVVELREQHDFVRSLYDTASAAATAAQLEAAEATAQVVLLKSQLRDGLQLHKDMTLQAVARWKAEVKRVTAQNEFLAQQAALSEGAEVRRKAALYDAYLQNERDKEQARQARIAAHEAQRQRMLQDLGMGSGAVVTQDATGPFAAPMHGNRSPSPIGELDELAALAREAALAGDVEADLMPSGRGKRRRGAGANLSSSNASNQPPPVSAEQLEREAIASVLALQSSQQDVDDQFATFMPRAPTGDAVQPTPDSGLDSMSMIPVAYGAQDESMPPPLAHDPQSAPSHHLGTDDMLDPADATHWGSLPPAPPPEATQSSGPQDLSGDTDTFQPYTQA